MLCKKGALKYLVKLIVQLNASDLTECLETLTINEHLRKSLKILSIAVDFTENISNFGVALKLSENRI